MKIEPISQADMARHNAKLKEDYAAKLKEKFKEMVGARYTMHDMVVITGWSQEYIFRLLKDGRIPQPKRRLGTKRLCRWTEDQARVILGFQAAQNERFNR